MTTKDQDLTITLKIKTLRVPVQERMPVIVYWSRHSKQAKTMKRLLSDQVDTTVFDEEFQISLSMQVDDDNMPTKPKMSQLTVASDKKRGILGKTDLDLSKFSYDDFKVHRIELNDCQFEGAWIEVGLKAAISKGSTRNNELNASYRSSQADQSDPAMTQARYQELLDQFMEQKKAMRSQAATKRQELNQLQARNNQLQTDYENAKMATAGAQKKAKQAQEEVNFVEQKIEEQKKVLEDKRLVQEETNDIIRLRDTEIEKLNADLLEKGTELNGTAKLIADAEDETQKAQKDLLFFFDIKRYDTNFLPDIVTLMAPKKQSSGRTGSFSKAQRRKSRMQPAGV